MNTNQSHQRTKSAASHWMVLCAAVALSAACGGSAPQKESGSSGSSPAKATATTPGVDVCGLLTAAEIEQALGKAPGQPQAGTGGLGECTWPAPEGSAPLVTLKLSTTDLDSYEAFVHSYQTEFGGEEPSAEYYHRIDDLGTWAMYVVDDGALRIYEGDRRLEVAVQPPDEARAVELGRLAEPRLK